MTSDDKAAALTGLDAAAAEAIEPAARRHEVEQLGKANDARIADLVRQNVAIAPIDVVSVRLAILVEHLVGDLDTEEGCAYERKVQEKLAELLDATGSQVRRMKLLDGVHGVHTERRPGHA
jgi:hypothetical protein